jgi:pyruvate/2-oxoglutarate dehydrogenase complex dihydrolipoamide dehydrogenase (E3) component
MATYDFDMGIIGAGSAGLTVAAGSAKFGAKTLLVEKDRMGGDCLHYGCVPSKTLIRTARVRHLMKNAPKFGLPAAALPPVDFREVRESILSVIGAIQKYDSPQRFCDLGVRVDFGIPVFTDEHSILLEGKTVSAKSWIIATGSSPSIPNIEGLAETPFMTNRDIFYLDALPPSLIMIGGGPVSIEMAQAFRRLGSQVTVVQLAGQILEQEDRDMADEVMNALAADGVRFCLNASVVRVGNNSGLREVTIMTKDGVEQALRAEALFVAVGRVANLEDLGLGQIGISYDRKGLKLDTRLRTTCRNIYGAGDVTGSYLFTHAAGYEGGIALSNAILRLPRKVDYRYLPWCTYTDPELAGIGMNETRARQAGIAYSVLSESFQGNDRALADRVPEGRIKLLLDNHGKPIGVQILGAHAGELMAEWTAYFSGGMKLYSLAGAVHPYPTLAEISKRVAGNALSEKIFSDRVKKTLRFFFNLRGRADCGASES